MGLFHSKVAHTFFRLRNLFFRQKTADAAHLIVEIETGRLRGKESKAYYSRKKYCSFLGVPFAKPPVEDLRFRPPQPCEPWKGVYDATYERDECIQKDPFIYLIIGEEDCMYMNIYTPKPPQEIRYPLPVMVFIHGGGFYFGSSSRKLYGADHLINEDVVLVAPNYRLHVLGFLNLGIEECAGNCAMKDQVFALQWVQRNIRHFGGDPNNVTIFGESAGATSVHYLMISPMAQGLFHKAILQSGLALAQWALTPHPVQQAFLIARRAGFRGTDRHELVAYLKKLSAGDLTRIAEEALDDQAEEMPTRAVLISPSIETIADGAFLYDHPANLIKFMKPIPTLFGHNDLEALIAFKLFRTSILDKIARDFSVILKANFKVDPDVLPILSEEVRELYFAKAEVNSFGGKELVELMTDLLFYRLYDGFEPLLKSRIPPYIYKFTYDGRLNFIKQWVQLTNVNLSIFSHFQGACHGDELGYLFLVKMLLFYPPVQDRDKKMIKLICQMWCNFARTGNPSTEEVEWKPATSKDLCYLEINDNPQMREGKLGGVKFEKLHEIMDPVAEWY